MINEGRINDNNNKCNTDINLKCKMLILQAELKKNVYYLKCNITYFHLLNIQ